MEAQVTRLKINATNIKNSLVGYNKQLVKLRAEENRLVFNAQKQEERKQKEEKLESGISKTIESVKSRIIAGPLGFFDKVKEFLGIVLLGLFINNLPKLIDNLKKFFADNAWIISVTKTTLKIIGDGIMGMIWLVDEYPASVMKAMDNERRYVAKEIDRVVAIANSAYGIWDKFLNGSPDSTPTPPVAAPVPGSMYPAPSPVATPSSSGQSTASPSSTPTSTTPVQKFAKGGTVKAKGQQSTRTTTTSGFAGVTPTPMGRKAIESIDSFENLSIVSLGTKINSQLLADRDGVNDTFSQVNQRFAEFLNFFKGKKKEGKPLDQMDPGSNRPGQSDPFSTSGGVEVSPQDIVGRIGSTGRSSGPHLHVETGDGWSGAGGNLSGSILNGVFIGGKSLAQLRSEGKQGEGLGAGRGHKGFDFPSNSGTPITLGPGLKFVEYAQGDNAGYGNLIIVLDANGRKYLLGHLSSGPTSEAMRKIKEGKKKKDVVAEKAGELLDVLKRNPETSSLQQNNEILVATKTYVVDRVIPGPPQIITKEVNSSTVAFAPNKAFSQLS